MPARKKKKAVKKKPADGVTKTSSPPPPKPTFEVECGQFDFACPQAEEAANGLFGQYGAAFVALCAKVHPDPIPLSYLARVIGPTLKGRPPVNRHRNSIKDPKVEP